MRFKLLVLIVAVSFAVRPMERKLGVLRPLSLALVFAMVSTVFGGLANHFYALKHIPAGKEMTPFMLDGLAEGMVPAAAGFAVLAVAWGLAAIGLRKQE
jgi:hypothetical protein